MSRITTKLMFHCRARRFCRDHQGRRRLYVEVTSGVTKRLHRFTYDDYLCIARNREVDAQHGIGSDAFVWDPTEPIATRPLMCDLAGCGALLYCHDGNKNVSETVSLYGTIAAHYDYSSFGKVVLVTSENEGQSTANLNPYRFSSEYADDALELVYYNYRHYNPKDGRWMSWDKLENEGSPAEQYDFCANNCLSYYDSLGGRALAGVPWRGIGRLVVRNFGEIEDGAEYALGLYHETKAGALREGVDVCMKGRSVGKCEACCVIVVKVLFGAEKMKYAVTSADVECSKCSEASKSSRLIGGNSFIGYLMVMVDKCE